MKRLAWYFTIARRELGLAGIAGAALLVVAVVFYLTALAPLEAKVAAYKDSKDAVIAEVRERVAATAVPASELQAFYEFFREDPNFQDRLAMLQAAAETAGINLRRTEYRLADRSAGQLKEYELILPVSGSYPGIRHFLMLLLKNVPTASIDYVNFQRRRVNESAVEAEIRITLFVAGKA